MDATLVRFLAAVRPRSRTAHRALFEDLAVLLDGFLRRRRRSARTLRACEVRSFLGYWYLRYRPLAGAAEGRKFCAAVRLLVRWLGQDRPPERAAALGRETARVARDTARAVRATELLEAARRPWTGRGVIRCEGYWEVVLQGATHVVLRGLEDGATVGPVPLPFEVARALWPGCILNLELARDGSGWRIATHGSCYPQVARPALRPTAGAV